MSRTSTFSVKRTLEWKAGWRQMPVSFKVPGKGTAFEWPLCIHIGMEDTPWYPNYPLDADSPFVISAWSEGVWFPPGVLEAEKVVQRNFRGFGGHQFTTYEETGESIARHVW